MAARGTPLAFSNTAGGPPLDGVQQAENEESSSSYVSTDPEDYMDPEYREAQAQALSEFNRKQRGKKKKKK